MARLPTVAGDSDAWGTVLNDWLESNASRGETTLDTATSIGATSVPLSSLAVSAPRIGETICIDEGSTFCEVRRITAVASSTVTVGALKFAHSAGAKVSVLRGDSVPIEFFGARGNDATYDSGVGIMAAMIDIANGNNYGLVGKPNVRYYSSIPISFYDNTYMRNIRFLAKAPFSINPMLGLRGGEPDQFFGTLGGQFGTVTSVNTTSNEITLSSTPGASVGARVIFYPEQGSTLPAPLEQGRAYYVKTNPSGTVFTISVDRDGTALDFTTAGSGTIYWFSEGLARLRLHDVWFEGAEIQGLNGLMAIVQQPSEAYNLRVQEFPGPKGLLVTGGQQGCYYNLMLADGSLGLNFQGGQFIYIFGGNIEDCDVLAQTDTVDAQGLSGYGRDIEIYGMHWESPGVHTNRTQTIMGNASVIAGTFTLSFNGETTSALNHNANAATIQSALEALTAIVPGDVTVTDEAGGLPSGRVRVAFGGAYAWKMLSGTQLLTVNTGGLTGGVYTMNRYYPGATGFWNKLDAASIQLNGGVWAAAGGPKPDGTSADFFLNDTPTDTGGYMIQNYIAMGQEGNAVKDNQRGITLSWADTTGVAERLTNFVAGGRHGGNVAKHWHLAGRTGGRILSWDEYSSELRFNSGAAIRYGDTGPLLLSGSGSPEGAITAPVGSVYLRTDGGTNTALYRKESGSGNTGWVAATNPSGSAGGYPRIFKSGFYYPAPPEATNETAVVMVLNESLYVPFPVGEAMTADRISVSVTTLQASSAIRLGIYADSDGVPGARLVDAGTIDSSTTGYKELTISQALSAGSLYWLVAVAQTAGGTVALRAGAVGNGSGWIGGAQTLDVRTANYRETISGALPATATPVAGTTTSPTIKLRAA